MRSSVIAVVLAVLGLAGCGDKGLTGPDGGVYIELADLQVTVHSQTVGDGVTVTPTDLVTLRAEFHGRGDQPLSKPVSASLVFTFEDNTAYTSDAFRYGPFPGGPSGYFTIETGFRISDGLDAVADKKPGQRISCAVHLDNGQNFSLFGFYVHK